MESDLFTYYGTDKDAETFIVPNASSKYDPVNKPFHYNQTGGIECIDYIKQVLGKEGFIAYCRGNAIKYQHRSGYKGSRREDQEKAEFYTERAIETMKEIENGE